MGEWLEEDHHAMFLSGKGIPLRGWQNWVPTNMETFDFRSRSSNNSHMRTVVQVSLTQSNRYFLIRHHRARSLKIFSFPERETIQFLVKLDTPKKPHLSTLISSYISWIRCCCLSTRCLLLPISDMKKRHEFVRVTIWLFITKTFRKYRIVLIVHINAIDCSRNVVSFLLCWTKEVLPMAVRKFDNWLSRFLSLLSTASLIIVQQS